MTYLVTGGTGLIGSRVVRDLSRDDEEVIVYDLFPDENALSHLMSEEERARVKIVQGDVTDLPHLMHIVKENKVENIIHLANPLSGASQANPPLATKTHCQGAINVFETARILGVRKVLWPSSHASYPATAVNAATFMPDEARQFPMRVYVACKAFNEALSFHYYAQYGADIVILRYGMVYGAMQRAGVSGSVFRELIENPALGKPGKVPFGDDTPDWLYVDDAARGTVLASKVPGSETRNFRFVCDTRSIKQVAEYVRKIIPGTEITVLPGSMGARFEPQTTAIDPETGYHYQWSVEQGIKETINLVRRQHGLSPV